MPTSVFISYSRHDTEYKDQLVRQLMVLERQGLLATWSDERIGLGGDWYSEVVNMMSSASVVILLITADFLTSEFILGEEVPRALQQWRESGLKVVPVYCRPCAWEAVPWLAKIQIWPRSAQPLWRNAGDDAASGLSELAHEIARMVGAPIPEAARDEPTPRRIMERRPSRLEALDLSALFAPLWVRVSTYLILLLFALYLVLFPRFIYGNCLIKVDNEETGDAYRGLVGVYVGSQMITVQMNEDGAWAVPMVSRLPKPVDLHFVYLEDGRKKYSRVRLSFFSVMFNDRQTIYVTPGSRPQFKVASFPSPGISFFAQAAYAQSQPPPGRKSSATPTVNQGSVQDRLISIAAEILKLPPSSLTPQSDLRKIFGADLVKSSQLVAALQREFQISIDNTAWDQLSTVDEIRRYIERKLAFFSGLDSEIDGALQRFLPHDGLYLSSKMKIPDKKLKNAKSEAKVPAGETIFGLIDGTILGSAKEALLFGHRGLYFRTSWTTTGPRQGFVSYDELAIRNITKEDWSEVSLGGGQYFVVAGTDFKAEELVDLLTRVQKIAQRRAAEAFAPEPGAIISAATVVLRTKADEKNQGTYVSIAIHTTSGEAFTWQDDRGEEWESGSDKKITLNRVGALPLASFENAKIKICMKRAKPHGWQFDYTGNLFHGTEMARSFSHKGNEITHGTGLSCIEEPLR
jgi:acyl carrier protein